MEKIASFKVNHNGLLPGVYVSRVDGGFMNKLTTFDLRFTAPYAEPPLDTGAMHAIEHIGATYFRNSEIKDKIIYFGPMGCRTGFYLIVSGKTSPEAIKPFVLGMLSFVESSASIPGASETECGNCYDLNLPAAKCVAAAYRKKLEEDFRCEYPAPPEDK